MQDKEMYMLLGKIQATQELQLKVLQELTEMQRLTDKRVSWVETKIHYAVGVITAGLFCFQLIWNYVTKTGKV